jgi:hypothetical protein
LARVHLCVHDLLADRGILNVLCVQVIRLAQCVRARLLGRDSLCDLGNQVILFFLLNLLCRLSLCGLGVREIREHLEFREIPFFHVNPDVREIRVSPGDLEFRGARVFRIDLVYLGNPIGHVGLGTQVHLCILADLGIHVLLCILWDPAVPYSNHREMT